MEPTQDRDADPILHVLHRGERIELGLETPEAHLRVTDRRLIVTEDSRVRLAIGYEELRRIQFDLEYDRPAVMVLVPHRATDQPQLLTIPKDLSRRATEVLAHIAERLP